MIVVVFLCLVGLDVVLDTVDGVLSSEWLWRLSPQVCFVHSKTTNKAGRHAHPIMDANYCTHKKIRNMETWTMTPQMITTPL